jgi:uncharacterized protein (DUF433 family)
MAKSKPFTMRLNQDTERWVEQEARRTRRSKGAVVEMLTEEGIRMRQFPGIGFKGPDGDRRAWVIGTGMDVWEIIEAYKDYGESLERLMQDSDVPESLIRLALAYYAAHPEKIGEAVAANDMTFEQAQRILPTLIKFELE